MKFVVHVTESAAIDELEAASWYERQREGLGYEFRAEVKKAQDLLADHALHHSRSFGDARRAVSKRLSEYGLFYVVRDLEVIVFAIVHAARNPALVQRRRRFLD